MLELDASPQAPADLIKDGTDASFAADVIEASQTVPVIVDFWAPWCGPCKTLGPAIEAAVTKAKGRVKLVKIDVDANQAYAGQLQVQSIPTVYAFFQGRPVDGFQGALPPSQIDAFVEKIAALGGEGADDGLTAAIEAADQMLAEGAATDAAETFAAILQEDPSNAAAYAGLVRAYLALDDVDQAEAILNGAPAEISTDPLLEAVHAQITLAREAANAGPVAELQASVAAEPDNHQARLDLAIALHANGQVEEAVAELLELFRRDREWNDGAAKAQLFKIFDAHDAKDPVVLQGRRKLSSMIFA
ncbi:co-chaperone YbbN [Cognatiyoonia sp. IB215446]|uniref:co-chaperone YbbN n=1 Tax=Cognatiyoonia sp. IB215446 TaxID=3097355 RepID=UPI002A0EB659|nr:co-chaperone YbbN [Cognatiyoonia sp. IB215446]MDX8350338.1 co-chaperone YbbN [Cognatiyoonia sp. IB215446]